MIFKQCVIILDMCDSEKSVENVYETLVLFKGGRSVALLFLNAHA